MELRHSQAPAERELLGSSVVRVKLLIFRLEKFSGSGGRQARGWADGGALKLQF